MLNEQIVNPLTINTGGSTIRPMLPEKITLVDLDKPLVDYWNEVFKDDPQVSAEQCDYFDVPADAMVSPARKRVA